MDQDTVIIDISAQGVASITLNRPDVHNAFDEHMIALLSLRLDEIAQNPDIRCVVLRGEGKSFSAGADLNWMKRAAEYTAEQNRADAQALATMLHKLYSLPQLTIACVHGAAMGGGFGLVACCDLVIASTRAKFCLSEVKLGLIPATIGPYVLRAIGMRQARRYFQTAEMIDVETAKTIGLVHEICADDKTLDEYCAEIIQNTAMKNGPYAMRQSKALCDFIEGRDINDDLGQETAQIISDIRAGDEAKEGLNSFFEKRKPRWIKDNIEG